MTVRSLRFLGIRSAAAAEMVRLYRDVLGLDPIVERAGATWFALADGTQVHVYDEADEDHAFFGAGPVVGLVVDDFDAARARMVAAGIAFIGEPQRDGGTAWNHYRAADGNVYEIIGPDRAPGEGRAADG
jgi:catechol 2,3-dioxygenase-like lactoylglutathione lyase family enzyme